MVELLRAIMEEVDGGRRRRSASSCPSRSTAGSRPASRVGDHKTSMLQDLEAGKPLELDCMTGAVIEIAGKLGVRVPHVEAVHACADLLDRRLTAR